MHTRKMTLSTHATSGLILLLIASLCKLSLSAVIHPPSLLHTVDFASQLNQPNLHVAPEKMRLEPPNSAPTESIRRNSYETTEPHDVQPTGSESKLNPAVFYAEPYQKMSPSFENIPAQYIGPNYAFNNGINTNYEESVEKSSQAVNPLFQLISQPALDKPVNSQKQPDTMNDMLTSAFKKYRVKKYLLKKILGSSHELDEGEGGFFSNTHLKRHGPTGMAAKVLGELIGIKIRESIEDLGKSFSEYAKDFTARNFVSLGNTFARMLKLH